MTRFALIRNHSNYTSDIILWESVFVIRSRKELSHKTVTIFYMVKFSLVGCGYCFLLISLLNRVVVVDKVIDTYYSIIWSIRVNLINIVDSKTEWEDALCKCCSFFVTILDGKIYFCPCFINFKFLIRWFFDQEIYLVENILPWLVDWCFLLFDEANFFIK